MLRKKPPRCSYVKPNGDPCKSYRLSKQGIQALLDQGISLVSNPEAFCSMHGRTEPERHRMAAKGGAYSPKQAKVKEEKERDPMPRQYAVSAYRLIGELLDARLPNVHPVEPDIRKQAVGAYLAGTIYAPPEDRAHVVHSLLRRSANGRHDLIEVAEAELRAMISELDEDTQREVWKLLTA
jgi:hypothetical protein